VEEHRALNVGQPSVEAEGLPAEGRASLQDQTACSRLQSVNEFLMSLSVRLFFLHSMGKPSKDFQAG